MKRNYFELTRYLLGYIIINNNKWIGEENTPLTTPTASTLTISTS
jgi:hypothetical protein